MVCNYCTRSNLNEYFNALLHRLLTVIISDKSQIGYILLVIKHHINLELFFGGALNTEKRGI